MFRWIGAMFGGGLMTRSRHEAALLRMHEAEKVKLRFMQDQIDKLRKERDALVAMERQ